MTLCALARCILTDRPEEVLRDVVNHGLVGCEYGDLILPKSESKREPSSMITLPVR